MELVNFRENSKVEISLLKKNIAAKDLQLKKSKEQIIDLEEKSMENFTKNQDEFVIQKMNFDRKLIEFKKRIEELEESGTTYKSQLANQ